MSAASLPGQTADSLVGPAFAVRVPAAVFTPPDVSFQLVEAYKSPLLCPFPSATHPSGGSYHAVRRKGGIPRLAAEVQTYTCTRGYPNFEGSCVCRLYPGSFMWTASCTSFSWSGMCCRPLPLDATAGGVGKRRDNSCKYKFSMAEGDVSYATFTRVIHSAPTSWGTRPRMIHKGL